MICVPVKSGIHFGACVYTQAVLAIIAVEWSKTLYELCLHRQAVYNSFAHNRAEKNCYMIKSIVTPEYIAVFLINGIVNFN